MRRSSRTTDDKPARSPTFTPTIIGLGRSMPQPKHRLTEVGNAEEQERHATSTLLSTMMAVRDFGRALVARFGGPAGSIETYLDLPFTLEERTSIPDGVIRVARAGRTWTALSRSRPVPARYGRSRSSATWIWPASRATTR
jgi:hypothetical protein